MKPKPPVRVAPPARKVLWLVAWSLLLGLPAVSTASPDASVGKDLDTLPDSLRQIYFAGVPETVEDLRLMDAHQRELVKRLTQVTVALQIGPTHGSGVIISEDGYVLTAAHVAGRVGLDVRVTMPDGTRLRGQTLGMNRGVDAALIKIDATTRSEEPVTWPYAELGNASRLRPGAWCMALGHPGGFDDERPPVPRFGRILSRSNKVLETDCKLVGGDSGGPLFDMEGNVIGIHSRIGNKLTKNLHVPADTYRDDWDRLARGDSWGSLLSVIGRPVIGVLGEKDTEEARIATVIPASPAERAGIRSGDLVTRFSGKEVTSFDTLKRLVGERNPGDEVKIEVLRGDKALTFSVVLAAYSGNTGR